MKIFFLLSVDNGAGRFDDIAVPQQACMELLVQDAGVYDQLSDSKGDFLDVKLWPGVYCNRDDEITTIKWIDEPIGTGTLDLRWIPRTCTAFISRECGLSIKNVSQMHEGVTKFCFTGNSPVDSFEFKDLPPKLTALRLQANFEGTIDLQDIPQLLVVLKLDENQLQGTVHLEDLRQPLEECMMSNNFLSGTINLRELPESLVVLYLDGNCFYGTIDLTRLPRNICKINLSDNQLHGSIHLANAPVFLQGLFLWNNKFTGDALLESVPLALNHILLFGNMITGVVDVQGIPVDEDRYMLEFESREFRRRVESVYF